MGGGYDESDEGKDFQDNSEVVGVILFVSGLLKVPQSPLPELMSIQNRSQIRYTIFKSYEMTWKGCGVPLTKDLLMCEVCNDVKTW